MAINKRLISTATAGGLGQPTDNFDIVTYSGTSAEQSFNLGFEPDIIWIMGRNTSGRNYFVFDNTGADSDFDYLHTYNATATEGASGVSTSDTGFTLQSSFGWNYTGITYVAWCWKAASSYSSNTDGSITSTIGANPDAGFSIVKYTGNASNSTVGHGLSVAPDLIITKGIDSVVGNTNWLVYNSISGATGRLVLNQTGAFTTSSTSYNNTEPTSSVFTIGTTGDINGNGAAYIAYCFHSVDGYQKIGTYAGTSYTQNDISLSFAPRFVMVKNITSSAGWYIFDLSRDVANGNGKYLEANSTAVESNIGNGMIFLSNGFRWKDQPDNKFNASGQTYIYLAIA